MNKILFVHMPKCAGTSIRAILNDTFPSKKIILQNSAPMSAKFEQRAFRLKQYEKITPIENNTLVFGHIFPCKYIGPETKDVFLTTFLRNPLDRLISQYNFWKNREFPRHSTWLKCMENDWSFYEFAMSKELQNFYSQYFVNIPISRFNFIGSYEYLNKSWTRFCEATNATKVDLPHINITQKKWINREEISSLAISEIEDFHSEDYKIYDYAKSFMLPKVI